MLETETISEIANLVRSGFFDKERLLEIFGEEMYEPGELDMEAVSTTIEAEFSKWEADKKTWPSVTDCDRLDRAFDALECRGVIALQNAGYTQSDGYDDFRDIYEDCAEKDSILGYCYYHQQDMERAVEHGILYLAFGPVDAREEETRGAEVGKIVREELEKAGLKVEWDGTFNKRILIPDLVWQRR